jgi:uncharacterized protein GlcG (DUF336 family)
MNNKSLTAFCVALAMALSVSARAQTPAAAGAAPASNQVPRDTSLLPGDAVPWPLERVLKSPKLQPGAPLPKQKLNTTLGPPLALAVEAAQAAIDACKADGVMVGAAVVDSAGMLRVGLTSDGAEQGRIFNAARKGLTALEFKVPTSEAQKQLAAEPALMARINPGMSTSAGGVPLMVGSKLLGAIGVSGSIQEEDEKCAAAGAAKISPRLQ